MTLIVEDGSIVPNANTYVSDAEYTAYCDARGLTYGADAAAREKEIIKGMDLIESYRDQFQGSKTQYTQPLQWPRVAVYIDDYPVDSDSIPKELKYALIEAASASNTTDIIVNQTNSNIKKEKVDVLEVEYFDGGENTSVILGRVNVYLQVLLSNSSTGAFSAMTIRV